MATPPQTEEGWYALHDFRTVDWDAWRAAPDRERERAIEEGVAYLEAHEALEDVDAGEGDSAVCSVLGDEADLLIVHFRPSVDDLSAAERRFEATAFAEFTERADSYLSVTEVSDYVSDSYFADDDEEVDEGIRRYIEGKLHPEIPADEYVCFYPMSRRRDPEQNWYQLPYEERADLLAGHGEIGREYAGRIKQVIASSVGLDDHEWGVTLFADDLADVKDIVYEMRFDEASAAYADFGDFLVGRRFPPSDLGAYLAGERVPTSAFADGDADTVAGDDEASHAHAHAHAGGDDHHGADHTTDHDHDHDDAAADVEANEGDEDDQDEDDIRGQLEDLNIYAGKPRGEDVYATVLYSEADPGDLFDEVSTLRDQFDHYGTHVKTAVYEARDGSRSAVVSIWDTGSAAETAAGFLSDLPGIVARAGEESGFGTMGMFYTIKPEHTEEFKERFDEVGALLSEMDGHHRTDLMVNHEDDNDTFIASQWGAQEDAMAFFRSEEFRETVQWGRDVLADRPRHVFLA
jgi:chlorite dismutase